MSDTVNKRIEWWRWVVAVGVTAGVAVPSLLPSTGVESVVALGLHAVAGAILVGGYRVAFAVGRDKPSGWWWLVVAAGVVVGLELAQSFVPGRTPMVVDVLAGWGGAVAATVVWRVR